MRISTNMILQVLGTIGQILNVTSGVVPAKYEGLAAAVIAGVQLIVGGIAHFSNPDGTPAIAPYKP